MSTTDIYTLSLHDALPIFAGANVFNWAVSRYIFDYSWAKISTKTWKDNLSKGWEWDNDHFGTNFIGHPHSGDRKSTRLNSSHTVISYAVFCLKKKKNLTTR